VTRHLASGRLTVLEVSQGDAIDWTTKALRDASLAAFSGALHPF
jgi:hypothetical protein